MVLIEDLFRLAKRALKPGGRMVCLEPTFLEHQSRMSRWLLNQDRGKGIRTQLEWQKLFTSHFPNSSVAETERHPTFNRVYVGAAPTGGTTLSVISNQ